MAPKRKNSQLKERISEHLPHSEFFEKAGQLFELSNSTDRTVHLVVKRYVERDPVEGNVEFDYRNSPLADISKMSGSNVLAKNAGSDKQYKLLVRISIGQRSVKSKYSTLVDADDLDKFWKEYVNVVKGGMKGLIKKKKKKSGKKV